METVKADLSANKVTVIGKVDPIKLKDKLVEKTKKNVEIVSAPQPKKVDAAAGEKPPEKKPEEKKPEEKKPEENKPKEVITVYFYFFFP